MVLNDTKMNDYLKDDSLQKNIFFYFFSNSYLDYLKEHGRKESTIELYTNILRKILKVLGEETSIDDVDEATVSFLIRKLTVSESTARIYLHVFGGMMEYATGQNPVRRAKILWNNVEPDRVFISKEEFTKILENTTFASDRLAM